MSKKTAPLLITVAVALASGLNSAVEAKSGGGGHGGGGGGHAGAASSGGVHSGGYAIGTGYAGSAVHAPAATTGSVNMGGYPIGNGPQSVTGLGGGIGGGIMNPSLRGGIGGMLYPGYGSEYGMLGGGFYGGVRSGYGGYGGGYGNQGYNYYGNYGAFPGFGGYYDPPGQGYAPPPHVDGPAMSFDTQATAEDPNYWRWVAEDWQGVQTVAPVYIPQGFPSRAPDEGNRVTDIYKELVAAQKMLSDYMTVGKLGTFDVENYQQRLGELRQRQGEVTAIANPDHRAAAESQLLHDVKALESDLGHHDE